MILQFPAADDLSSSMRRPESALVRATRLYRVLPHRWIQDSPAPAIAAQVSGAIAPVLAECNPNTGREMPIVLKRSLELPGSLGAPECDWAIPSEPVQKSDMFHLLGYSGAAQFLDQPLESLWNIEGVVSPAAPSPAVAAPSLGSWVPVRQARPRRGVRKPAQPAGRCWRLTPSMPDGCGTILRIDSPRPNAVEGTCEVQPEPLMTDEVILPGFEGMSFSSVRILNLPVCWRAELEIDVMEEDVDKSEVDRFLATLDFESGSEIIPIQTHIRIAPTPAEDAEEPELAAVGVMQQYKIIKVAATQPERPVAYASALDDDGGSVTVMEEPLSGEHSDSQSKSNRTVPTGPCGKEPIVSRGPVSIIKRSIQKFGSQRPFLAATAKLRAVSGHFGGSANEIAAQGPIGRLFGNMSSAWKSVPQFARGIALVAVPLLIPTLFYARIGPSEVSNTSAWASVKQAIKNRATILIEEDFDSGLTGWASPGDSLTSWSVDEMKFVQPGKLALLQKSIPLTDYRFEFSARLEQKSMSFVIRAADTRNYYVSQLVVVREGPQPLLNIVHYPVVDGVEGPKTELPLPLQMDLTKMFTVLGTVRGENFTVSINGQMVDNWSDSRFLQGGIGFYTEKGARYRLKWVRVVDKDDFLGWLCSRISPGTADIRASGEHQ
jgi:hypothetical protein